MPACVGHVVENEVHLYFAEADLAVLTCSMLFEDVTVQPLCTR